MSPHKRGPHTQKKTFHRQPQGTQCLAPGISKLAVLGPFSLFWSYLVSLLMPSPKRPRNIQPPIEKIPTDAHVNIYARMMFIINRQVYNLFQDLWNKFVNNILKCFLFG